MDEARGVGLLPRESVAVGVAARRALDAKECEAAASDYRAGLIGLDSDAAELIMTEEGGFGHRLVEKTPRARQEHPLRRRAGRRAREPRVAGSDLPVGCVA